MTNHPLNNSMVLCTKDNKEELAKFLRNHKVNNNMTIVSADLTDNFYFGLINGEFTFANYHNVQDEIQKTNISYYTLEQAIAKFGHETITVNVGSVDNTPKSFPRVMWVKDKEDSVDAYCKRVVIAFARNQYIAWTTYSINTSDGESLTPNNMYDTHSNYETVAWDQALELDELKVVTKQELAELVNTTVDKLKIID